MAKKKYITVNKVKYPVKAFDFNMVCELEDMGISFEDIQKKPMSIMRAYIGSCMNKDVDFAGKEIEKHIVDGGNLDEVSEVIAYELENSDFFRSLTKKPTEED